MGIFLLFLSVFMVILSPITIIALILEHHYFLAILFYGLGALTYWITLNDVTFHSPWLERAGGKKTLLLVLWFFFLWADLAEVSFDY